MIPCMHKAIFGMECMGCGTQRALLLLTKGEFLDAFYMYPPIYTMIPFFLSLALHFIDRKHNYSKLIIVLAIINALTMATSYLIKQFL